MRCSLAVPTIETSMFGRSISTAAVKRLDPTLVVLVTGDVPEDAVETARGIMGEVPKPVVLAAAMRPENADELLARSGALALLELPVAEVQQRRFVAALEAMAEVKVVRRWRRESSVARSSLLQPAKANGQLVAIVSSTGGPGALQQIFSELPAEFRGAHPCGATHCRRFCRKPRALAWRDALACETRAGWRNT